MDNPTTLLKSAAFESVAQLRTLKVVKACKMITDSLPFEKKNHILLEEHELMKYLMLCLPINPTSIHLIIVSMIEKFKKVHHFLKETWIGFDAIAELPEKENQKSEKAVLMLKSGLKKLMKIQSITTEETESFDSPKVDYCLDINRNKEYIKLKVLDYVEYMIELYYTELKDAVPFRPDVQALLKKFLKHTPNEKAIVKTCQILERLKDYDGAQAYDYEVEELLLSKKSLLGEKNLNREKRPGQKLAATIFEAVRNQSTKKEENTGNFNLESKPTLKALLQKNLEEKKEEIIEDHATIAANIYEDWLSDGPADEPPLIIKSDAVRDFIRHQENLEILFTYIFDPTQSTIHKCWGRKLEQFKDAETIDLTMISTKIMTYQNFLEDPRYNIYMYRSFRVMQAICDVRNFKYLTQVNRQVLDQFFNVLYTNISRPETIANFNHIARIIDFFTKKETEICMSYMMYYNLPFRFILYIDFPILQHFMLALFNCTEVNLEFGNDTYKKFIKYCELTGFFHEISNSILYGEKGLNANKLDVTFRPSGLDTLANLTQDHEFGMIRDEKPYSYQLYPEGFTYFIEESHGFQVDIDGIQYALADTKYFDPEHLLSIPQESADKTPKKGKRYPSLKKDEPKNDVSINASPQNMKPRFKSYKTGYLGVPQNRQTPTGTLNNIDNKPSFHNSEKPSMADNPELYSSEYDSKTTLEKNNSKPGSRMNYSRNKASMNKIEEPLRFIPPVERNIKSEIDPEIIGRKELESLLALYPVSTRNSVEKDIDRESKKPEFKVSYIKQNEAYCLALCEFIEIICKKTLQANDASKIKSLIGLPDTNYVSLWNAMFSDGKASFFERIFKAYLFKIKMHNIDPNNSGYASGSIVNIILEKSRKNLALQKHADTIHRICLENFLFLCKTIVFSHAWICQKDLKVYLQDFEVKQPLGNARIMLAKTLLLIIENDSGNDFDIIQEINDTTWHTLLIWYFEKKTNNMYQNLFFQLMNIALTRTPEKTVINILFKLNMVSSMWKCWSSICQNNVLLSESHVHAMKASLIKMTTLVDDISKFEQLKTVRMQLMTSSSWHSLRETLIPERVKADKQASEEAMRKSMPHGRKSIMTDRSVSFKHGGANTPSPDQKSADTKKKHLSKLSPRAESFGKILLVPPSEK